MTSTSYDQAKLIQDAVKVGIHVSRITPFDGTVSTVFDGLPTSASRSL
jgi:hypothetical protein